MRTFLAVEIDDQTRAKLGNIVNEFKRMDLPIKWVRTENMHITLKFIGEVDETGLKKIRDTLFEMSGKFNTIQMSLKGFGCFPGPRDPRVIWVGVDQGAAELTKLAYEIEAAMRALGFKPEKKFHPHLTIGRTRKSCSVDHILTTEFQGGLFSIKDIVLMESTLTPAGPIYRSAERFELTPV